MKQILQWLILAVGFCLTLPIANADVISTATLNYSLDGAAFANGADVPYINAFGKSINPAFNYNTNQTFLEFAGHNAASAPGRPAAPPTTFNDFRTNWVRPNSSALSANYSSNAALQTFAFNPANVTTAGATGQARFDGGDTFWFANDSLINPVANVPASVWLQFGNLGLTYDASRNTGANSGWLFSNNIAGNLAVFDARNITINVVAATAGTPGSLTIAGDFFTSAEFANGFGIQPGIDVGNFTFSAITAVPEPTSLTLLALVSVVAATRFRRVRTRAAAPLRIPTKHLPTA
jgi:hypothetical protein